LLNECGEVIGLNMSQPGAEAGVRAISAGSLISLLKQQNIKVNQAATACISPISIAIEKANLAATEAEKAKEKALQAERIVKALESKLAASNQRNQKLSSEINQARLSAEKALVSAAETEETARKTRSDLEEKTESILSENRSMVEHLNQDRIDAEDRYRRALEEQKQASESRELMLISFFIVFVVVVSVFLLMLVRGLPARSQKAALLDNQIADKQIADKPIADVPPPMMYRSSETQLDEPAEYVLEGRDEDGIRYLLRISGDRLMRNDGVVIGRNPQDSPYVINHADVSRKHARMKVMKDRVFIEDLGSTNGTSVNGQTIDSKGPVSVASGDQIIIGSVVMKLRVLNE